MTTTGPRLAPSDLSPTLGRSKRRRTGPKPTLNRNPPDTALRVVDGRWRPNAPGWPDRPGGGAA